ncbi:hypothetical protein DPEC_G00021650 [Dallia pectoralis]|uniref:Uncharacterized protein n=1 Tax=Dallia pectoralis TaxID=75939 RepID=A0ACC2HH48_DALPE|nr:hypothetical protein DPEC_G00021650 [Dallia pectoralis]
MDRTRSMLTPPESEDGRGQSRKTEGRGKRILGHVKMDPTPTPDGESRNTTDRSEVGRTNNGHGKQRATRCRDDAEEAGFSTWLRTTYNDAIKARAKRRGRTQERPQPYGTHTVRTTRAGNHHQAANRTGTPPPSHHTTADVPPLGETVRGAETIVPPAPLSRHPHAQPGTQQRLHEHKTRLPSAVVSRAATVCGTKTDQAVEETVRLVMEQNQEGLTETQQRQLWDIIYKHLAAFATGPTDMGRTHILQHEIDTGISHPIRQRPRRLPLMKQAAADQCLEEMRAAGVVEPSESPWMSPVVLVKKKDGTWRYCVDFRQLNDITVKDSYPLPRVNESLDRIKGSVWFSSLDLRSGYWQVPLATEARPKTAFSTGSGLWQFTAMPFGLCNAPATFERLMERVLADVPGNNLQVYLDDVLVHGVNFEAALTALQTVLSKIQQAGLKLNPGKCKLMRKELVFLGP